MPRLARSLLKQASKINTLLPLLLRPCRDLRSASNELRWLQEFADKQNSINKLADRQRLLRKLCVRRARGEPLQYLLGTEFFGELELLCRRGVLIPRADTENYVTHLANLLTRSSDASSSFRAATNLVIDETSSLRLLDLCTGTGCIALWLHNRLSRFVEEIQIQGIDISPRAINLARQNLVHNINLGTLSEQASNDVRFARGDVLSDPDIGRDSFDIAVSNPPYISETSFVKNTEPSVRRFEPRNALIPDHDHDGEAARGDVDRTGDVFYDKLMEIGERASAKLLVMEVEDQAQAMRVVSGASCSTDQSYWKPYAIWCDGVGQDKDLDLRHVELKEDLKVRLEGDGHARAVVLVRRD